MAAPKGTLWPRDPHTEGKHLVLENYLNAWFPIMGMGDRNRRILFVDGFAGPGEYEGREEGSPLVAMRVLAKHSAGSRINAEVVFQLIEKEAARAQHLRGLVEQWRSRLPTTAKVNVWEGSFESLITDVLDQLDEQKNRMAPALVMMDPFGVKGIPMRIVQRILANPKCEVFVTFMWEAIDRHITAPEFEDHMTALFGTEGWKQGVDLTGGERRDFLHHLYRQQLKAAGAEQAVHFHLFKGNRHKYSVFFGTGHKLGLDRMKQAIWKADPLGGYNFRGKEQGQMEFLDLLQPDFVPLQDALQDHFAGVGWVSIEDVREFVRSDRTIYHEGQLRKRALKPMEKTRLLRVKPGTRKKGFTYPDTCRIAFHPRSLRFL